MNINKLGEKLEKLKIPKHWYNIVGYGMDEQKICLEKTDKGFEVFYSERGNKFDYLLFDNESDACKDVLKRIKKRK